MEFELDHEIRLTESKSRGLYSWSLQELSKDGNPIGHDQIPWIWTLHFTASQFQYRREIKLETQLADDEPEGNAKSIQLAGTPTNESEDEELETAAHSTVTDTESITAKLQSGIPGRRGRFERDATFSMFGTNRAIENFSLRVLKLDEENMRERCNVWGCVRYTSEVDFRAHTQDDAIEVSLWLTPKRFGELRDMLVNEAATLVQISLHGVSGFYSDWSPSISTSSVKVLTRGKEHQVLATEGCDVSPPRLGAVSEFELSVIHNTSFDAIHGSETANDDETETDPKPDAQGAGAAESRIIAAHVFRAEQALKGLRIPLWIIVVLLALLLFR